MKGRPSISVLLKTALPVAFVACVATFAIWLICAGKDPLVIRAQDAVVKGEIGSSLASLYTPNYPANRTFQQELALLRTQGRLLPENEVLINRTIQSSSGYLSMPPAVLWCLLFQESRLNHLEGLHGDSGARGLGQFSYFSFYEVNHHLDRYTGENTGMMMQLLGKDIRPVEPRVSDLLNPSSYYYIPTAVVSSSSYLNNRYTQLKRYLDRRGITYSPDLLWLYAAMAYNKGTRSVLIFWNDARARGGNRLLQKLVNDRASVFRAFRDGDHLTAMMKKIWPDYEAVAYAKELKIHMQNMKDCAITPEEQSRVEVPQQNRWF